MTDRITEGPHITDDPLARSLNQRITKLKAINLELVEALEVAKMAIGDMIRSHYKTAANVYLHSARVRACEALSHAKEI